LPETIRLVYANVSKLSKSQKKRFKELQKDCFSRVDPREIAECFVAKGFGVVLAYRGRTIVGQIELFLRTVKFEERRIQLGGLGGTCVTTLARNRNIGSRLVKKGMEILKRRNCDIACLNANVRDYPSGGLYHNQGFRVMKRRISFSDVYGETRYDTGEMFAPLRSKSIYHFVMNNRRTFHMGKGYW
jgi:GNAT superfamily N-acetyltransferase